MLSELSNICYFGHYSKPFEKYPQFLKEAIEALTPSFIKATTTDGEVNPDFEIVSTDEEFQIEKKRVFKEYLRRLAVDVYPGYLAMVEKTKATDEKKQKEAVK